MSVRETQGQSPRLSDQRGYNCWGLWWVGRQRPSTFEAPPRIHSLLMAPEGNPSSKDFSVVAFLPTLTQWGHSVEFTCCPPSFSAPPRANLTSLQASSRRLSWLCCLYPTHMLTHPVLLFKSNFWATGPLLLRNYILAFWGAVFFPFHLMWLYRPEMIDFYFIPISVTGPTLQLPSALPAALLLLNYGQA